MVTSILSSLLAKTLTISNQAMLGVAYGILSLGVFATLLGTKWKGVEKATRQEGSEATRAVPVVAEA